MPGTTEDNGMAELLRQAFPVEEGSYVTRGELRAAMEVLQTKLTSSENSLAQQIKTAEVVQRNWVLTGCLAILLTFGGGYISVIMKLDRLSQALPTMQQTLDDRRSWMLRQEQRDDRQDSALRGLDKNYNALPYEESPK